jgi:hypothetical protein
MLQSLEKSHLLGNSKIVVVIVTSRASRIEAEAAVNNLRNEQEATLISRRKEISRIAAENWRSKLLDDRRISLIVNVAISETIPLIVDQISESKTAERNSINSNLERQLQLLILNVAIDKAVSLTVEQTDESQTTEGGSINSSVERNYLQETVVQVLKLEINKSVKRNKDKQRQTWRENHRARRKKKGKKMTMKTIILILMMLMIMMR